MQYKHQKITSQILVNPLWRPTSGMNNIHRLLVGFLVLIYGCPMSQAQSPSSITLEQCYTWTHENYPMIQQMDLIDKSAAYNIQNASKGNLPQINIHGQASYQSDVTKLAINLPNVDIPSVNKDQYKLQAEIYQPLTNRSAIAIHKKQVEANSEIEKQEINVALYKLKDRVNQIYFGIMLIDGQIDQYGILLNDIDRAIEKTDAAIQNGLAIESNGQLLKAERVFAAQKIQEQRIQRAAFVTMLSTLTRQSITSDTRLERPESYLSPAQIDRPELRLYELQGQSIGLKFDQIENRLIPQIGLFLQGGYGSPGLNFLSNEFEAYYIGGLKLNWNLSSLYTSKNDKELLNLSRQKIVYSKSTFLLNTDLTMSQQSSEIIKYKALINSDQELVELRKSIKETAEFQLSNGLITSLDYITYVNAENRARQNLILHSMQLLLAQYNLKTTSGH